MKNDGGSAYPVIDRHEEVVAYGMTMRQFYKGQLSASSLVKQCLAEMRKHENNPDDIKAVLANFGAAIGDMADALIAEDEAFAAREGKPERPVSSIDGFSLAFGRADMKRECVEAAKKVEVGDSYDVATKNEIIAAIEEVE